MLETYADERAGREQDRTLDDLCRLRADGVLLMMNALCSWRVLEARCVFPCLDPMGVL